MYTLELTDEELNAVHKLVEQEYLDAKGDINEKVEIKQFWTNLYEKTLLALNMTRSGSTGIEHVPEATPYARALGTTETPNDPIGYHGGTDPTWNAGNKLVTDADIPNP